MSEWADHELSLSSPPRSPTSVLAVRSSNADHSYDHSYDHEQYSSSGGLSRDVPLQYHSLFAEASPEQGRIIPAALNALLRRAKIHEDAAVNILEGAGARRGSIDETHFNWALAWVAIVQRQPGTVPDPKSEPPTYSELLDLLPPSNEQISDPIPYYDPTSPDSIQITPREELEGAFMFKHVVYNVEATFEGVTSRVIRRYSDFAKLLDTLVEKFPFRAIPVLPPKRLAMNGHFLSGDNDFIEHRRRGLIRFSNLLMKHPVLGKVGLVKSFFTQQSGRDSLLGGAATALKNELEGLKLSPLYVSQWDASSFENRLNSVKNGTETALAEVTALCLLLDRAARRRDVAALDATSFATSCSNLSSALPRAFPDVSDDLSALSHGLSALSRFSNTRSSNLGDAANRIRHTPSEDLKKFRDMLMATRELFTRYTLFGGNEIPKYERRIDNLRSKITEAATKPDVSQEVIRNLHAKVDHAIEVIRQQTNRDWVIKEQLSRELIMIQNVQYQLSVALKSFGVTFFAEIEAENDPVAKLTTEVDRLPHITR